MGLALVQRAPHADPLELEIRGFNLSLRKDVAQEVRVRRVEDKGGKQLEANTSKQPPGW